MALARAQEWVRIYAEELASPGELDLTIIIVSYNTRQKTLDCIRSVINSTFSISYEIIVVDNASADGSVDAIRANFPDITVIECTKNLGFATANNLAEEYARGRKLLLLNPDTVIVGQAVDELYSFALSNPVSRMWGGRSIHRDGSLDWSCRDRMTLWNVFCFAIGLSFLFNHPREHREWKRDSVRRVDVLDASFLLIDRDLWRRLDGFDPSFFMYGEDEDICLRAEHFGARPTFTPAATIVHYGSSSEQSELEKRIKLMAGEITVINRHWPTVSAFIGRRLFLVIPHPRWMIYGLLGLLTRRSDLQENAKIWWRVWQARREWAQGWPSRNSARSRF